MLLTFCFIPGVMVGIEFPPDENIISIDLFLVRVLIEWGGKDE